MNKLAKFLSKKYSQIIITYFNENNYMLKCEYWSSRLGTVYPVYIDYKNGVYKVEKTDYISKDMIKKLRFETTKVNEIIERLQ